MMDMEKFYIYRETEAKNQINKLTVQNNGIFETIVNEDPFTLGYTIVRCAVLIIRICIIYNVKHNYCTCWCLYCL
jgi:hypothetical protein